MGPTLVLKICEAGLVGCVGGRIASQAARQILVRRGLLSESAQLPSVPLIMSLSAVACVTLLATYGVTLELAQMAAFLWILLVCSLTDVAAWLIPNGCVLAAMAIRAIYLVIIAFVQGPLVTVGLAIRSLTGAFAVGIPLLVLTLIMDHVLQTDSMGGGDLKLFSVAGAFFGWRACLFLVPLSCILGILFALTGKKGSRAFPFGPAIALSCWLTSLFGAGVVAWYGSLPL